MTRISADEFASIDGLGDWRFVLGAISAEFEVTPFSKAATLVAAIGEAADAADHHPEVALRYPGRVRVSMHSHDTGGLTERDVALARTISALASEAAATSHPMVAQAVEIAIDTMDADRIRPFWKAVLGYTEATDGSLFDPARIGPPVWFQRMDEPRTERQRFHLDVSVPHDVALERLTATVAAGGRLVTDQFARSFWVMADADGNEACICTWQDRAK